MGGPPPRRSGRPFPADPWFYHAFERLGTTIVVIAAIPSLLLLCAVARAVASLVPWGAVVATFAATCASLLLLPAGAAVLLLVDVARNIRRLRQHADRNAGIE